MSTKYLQQLSKEELNELLKSFPLSFYGNNKEVRTQFGKWENEKTLIISTDGYDGYYHDCIDINDFMIVFANAEKIRFSEHEFEKKATYGFENFGTVPTILNALKSYHKFMINKFGEEYKKDCIAYFADYKTKQIKKSRNYINEKLEDTRKVINYIAESTKKENEMIDKITDNIDDIDEDIK